MPTPSHNAPNPLSPHPRSHPFSSCPDPEASQDSQLSHLTSDPITSPEPLSPTQVSEPATHTSGTVVGDSRSVTMSPGPQLEDGMSTTPTLGDVGDRHKPAGTEGEMDPAHRDEALRRTGIRGSREGDAVASEGGEGTNATALSGPPGRRKSNTGQQLATTAGQLEEVDAWSPWWSGPRWVEDSGLVGLGAEYSHMRLLTPAPSLYLQPGSRFVGTQQSERQRYDVDVEIKHVDMRESFLCGYLKIQGLTDDHPTLTTYFEGEIIGPKYSFITQHPSWGATEKIDMSHWSKFGPFRPYHKQARKVHPIIPNPDQREHIFMRWKEHFLVPDHRVRTINGASFEGFYYICFNQLRGEVNGIYFHSKSEKFQQLELKYVDNRGCYAAMEFR
ncbi:hypothetical protein VTJ83DRAFT_4357 [Remersonia thermophila]|uniref:Uncharacterized protein n=1 Tax=Remersonia thermophila TaxID=72144 RepID=A0ABR4D9S9_9PEZI